MDFPELTSIMPQQDKGKPKPAMVAHNETLQWPFAKLAKDLGFGRESLREILKTHPDEPTVKGIRPAPVFSIAYPSGLTRTGLMGTG